LVEALPLHKNRSGINPNPTKILAKRQAMHDTTLVRQRTSAAAKASACAITSPWQEGGTGLRIFKTLPFVSTGCDVSRIGHD
ncbi:MAG: hypothetical protein JXA35_02880, partial [Deltaproteobacteria bacterium]|nr:hypothetical protein [Deltaproteobacteria bacterium]